MDTLVGYNLLQHSAVLPLWLHSCPSCFRDTSIQGSQFRDLIACSNYIGTHSSNAH